MRHVIITQWTLFHSDRRSPLNSSFFCYDHRHPFHGWKHILRHDCLVIRTRGSVSWATQILLKGRQTTCLHYTTVHIDMRFLCPRLYVLSFPPWWQSRRAAPLVIVGHDSRATRRPAWNHHAQPPRPLSRLQGKAADGQTKPRVNLK